MYERISSNIRKSWALIVGFAILVMAAAETLTGGSASPAHALAISATHVEGVVTPMLACPALKVRP